MGISIENALKIAVICVFIAALADILDFAYFYFYKTKDGLSFFEPTGIDYKIRYLKTKLGFIFTALGIFPYLIAALFLKISK